MIEGVVAGHDRAMAETRKALQLDLSRSASLEAWRTFELATEQADRLGLTGRSYWVYVVQLSGHLDLDKPTATTVFVGQTHIEPIERLKQHREGYRADPRVAEHGSVLREDLFVDQPELRSRQEAEAYQALLAETLDFGGYSVYTGS